MNQQSNNDASNPARFGPDVFRWLADTSVDGIGMTRLDSRIIYANTTLRRLRELLARRAAGFGGCLAKPINAIHFLNQLTAARLAARRTKHEPITQQ